MRFTGTLRLYMLAGFVSCPKQQQAAAQRDVSAMLWFAHAKYVAIGCRAAGSR
jgi:hypothetical protein